jgi:hypothetical protein
MTPFCHDRPNCAEPPVGELCGYCEEPITLRDRGYLIPHLQDVDKAILQPWHIECFIRNVAGSVAHQRRQCGCYDKTRSGPCDNAALTRRQNAILAYRENAAAMAGGDDAQRLPFERRS